jgi:helicase
LHSIINEGKKVVYTCPLRALASEHHRDFKNKYGSNLKVKATISTGDFDSPSTHLANFDLVFTTYEKLDSLIRHQANWLNKIGALVVDEIHEIDSDRGPTLEMLITKLRLMNPKLKILGLSATVPNAQELSKWLSAELVQSDYRPVPLQEGIHFGSEIIYDDENEALPSKPSPLEELTADTLERGKQLLIFASTRRSAEQLARKLSQTVLEKLSAREKTFLKRHAEDVLNALEQPTAQCKDLATLVEKGVVFHHAGLINKQRTLLEDFFRQGKIKLIVATPTLAMGVNLPSHTVAIHSVYRYGRYGSESIPVREYKQWIGRAGRPKYDDRGRAVLIARNELEVDELKDHYVHGQIEEVTSKLGIEPVLRMHLLSLIASRFVFNLDSMEKFFAKTFYACQYDDISSLFTKLNELLEELRDMGFVELTERGFKATRLGNRVSELYLDPLSAFKIINALRENTEGKELAYSLMLTDSFELFPYPSVSAKQESLLWAELMEEKSKLFFDVERKMYDDEHLLNKYLLSKIFLDWISEVPEQELLETYRMQPGILRSKLRIGDWLLYACVELEKCLDMRKHSRALINLRNRLKYGIKEELLPLVQLRYIGRVRARALHKKGFKGVGALKNASLFELSQILGPKIAEKIKDQLGQKQELSVSEKKELKALAAKGQANLSNF